MARPREQHIGRYELLIELGHGGMAELFLARLNAPGGFAKLIAIKRILPHLARDDQFTQMFLDEGRIASRLNHPNICQVFELDDSDGELFLAMEYLDGVSWDHLHAQLADDRRLEIAAGVLAQAADGLHYAHTLCDVGGRSTPVVHRDVSPQNLFVTVDGICKVLDFGVSKMMTDGPRTRSGVVKGKLPYMAPEQIQGQPVDARTDVFSLGVCLWEALANERLFDRATDFLIWKAVTEEDAPDLTTRWPACPPVVAAVTRQALTRDPAQRFASARAFAEALRSAVPTLATSAAIGDALREVCGDRLAAHREQVAAVISTRDSSPKVGDESAHSASRTLDSGRSAAMTFHDKPRDLDAADTTDFRAHGAPRLRDRSLVVSRDADSPTARSPVESQATTRPRGTRAGLVIGTIATLLVAAAVIVVLVRGSSSSSSFVAPDAAHLAASSPVDAPTRAPPDASPASAAPDAAVMYDAAVTADATVHAVVPPRHRLPHAHHTPGFKPATPTTPTSPPVTAAPGSLSISSSPYATIYVDGRKLGDTPLFREPVAAGTHRIRAVRADGKEQQFSIQITSDKETNRGKLVW